MTSRFSLPFLISILALTRSATIGKVTVWYMTEISILALTRSATPNFAGTDHFGLDFNPRTHEECDKMAWAEAKNSAKFQSSHSRGVRQFTASNIP